MALNVQETGVKTVGRKDWIVEPVPSELQLETNEHFCSFVSYLATHMRPSVSRNVTCSQTSRCLLFNQSMLAPKAAGSF